MTEYKLTFPDKIKYHGNCVWFESITKDGECSRCVLHNETVKSQESYCDDWTNARSAA